MMKMECTCAKGAHSAPIKVLEVSQGAIEKVAEILKDFGGSETLLTIEPHLAVFEGLAGLQHEEVKHKFVYDSNLSAFRAAVSAIKDVLSQDGYKETEANRWTL